MSSGLVYSYNFQSQGLAYSSDGENFEKFEGNPVIATQEGVKDFSDPKVFWQAGSSKWVSIISQGDHAVFYSSENLVDWQFLSEFAPEPRFTWECPDIFPLQYEDMTFWWLLPPTTDTFGGISMARNSRSTVAIMLMPVFLTLEGITMRQLHSTI